MAEDAERVGRIRRNTFYNTFRSVVGSSLAFATGIAVARGLGPSETGLYTLVIWTALSTTSVVAVGFGYTLTKFLAQRNPLTDRTAISDILAFGIRTQTMLAAGGAAVLVVCSPFLADAFGSPDAANLFAIAGVIAFAGAFIELFTAPLIALERQGLLIPLKTFYTASALATAVVVLFVFHGGLDELVAAQAATVCIVALVHYAVASRIVVVRWRSSISRELKRKIGRTAIALSAISTLGLVVFQRSEVFILGYFSTTSNVAYYSIAYAMADALQHIVPAALAFAVFPNISRAFATGDRSFAQRAYEGQLRLTGIAIVPIAVAGSLLSGSAINVLYGAAFDGAAIPLAVLLFSAGANCLGQCAFGVLVGGDRERSVVSVTAFVAAANVALGLTLIPLFGLAGATTAELITQLLLATGSVALVSHRLGFRFPFGGFARIAAANVPVFVSVAAVVLVINESLATLIVGMVVALPAYALGLWATRALSPSEKRHLRWSVAR